MKQLFMAALAASLALSGAWAADTTVALAAATGSVQSTPQAETVQQSTLRALQDGKWVIVIYHFRGAGNSLRGETTFEVMNGRLMAVVNDRNTKSLMSVEVGQDGTITLTSLTSGSKINLQPKPSHDGFAGKSEANSGPFAGRQWDVDMSKS